jgi:hypothetical protein
MHPSAILLNRVRLAILLLFQSSMVISDQAIPNIKLHKSLENAEEIILGSSPNFLKIGLKKWNHNDGKRD